MKRILFIVGLYTLCITNVMVALQEPPTTFIMDQAEFARLQQSIKNALEAGASLNLSNLFAIISPVGNVSSKIKTALKVAPKNIQKIINSAPEAIVTFLSSMSFSHDLTFAVDETHQVIVIRGALDIPYTHGSEKLYGTIRISSNLQSHTNGSNVPLKIGAANAHANQQLLDALSKLTDNLHCALAIELKDSFRPTQIIEAIAQMPRISATAKRSLPDIERVFKYFDDVLAGNLTLALTDEEYIDPLYGTLYPQGINFISTLNIGAPYTNAFTKKMLSIIGSAPSFEKGISANIFVPASILGTILRVSLPGEIIFGVPGTKTKLARIDRWEISSRIGGGRGLSQGFMDAEVTGRMEFYPPWQKDSIMTSVTFSLDSSTNVGIEGTLNELDVPGLPVALNNAFFSAKINAARIFKFITDLIIYVAESAGEQAGAVETAGATEALEGAETAEILEETASLLLMPFSELGVGGILSIIGRRAETELCFEYDATNNNIDFGILIDLAKGTANDFIGIKDLYALFVELQNHYLDIIEKSARLIHMQPSAELARAALKANMVLSQDILQYFPDFNLKTATLYMALKKMQCGMRTMNSGIEVAGAGTYLGQSIAVDLVFNIFGFINAMMEIIGDVADLASPTSTAEEVVELPEQIEQEALSVGQRLTNLLSSVPGKIAGKILPGKSSSTSSGGASATTSLLAIAAKGISTVLDFGILGTLKYGKINIGPLHLTNSENTDGPQLLLKLGYTMPSVSSMTSKQEIKAERPFLAGVLDGRINLDIAPGFEADVMGTLALSGINLISHGKLGSFDALVSGGININPLKNNLTINIVGGWEAILQSINDGFANMAKTIESTVQSASANLQKTTNQLKQAIQILQERIDSAQTIIDRYNKSIAECAAGNPALEGLNAIREEAQKIVQNTITASGLWQIVDSIISSTSFDYDAATISRIKNMVKNGAHVPGNPLSWILGL